MDEDYKLDDLKGGFAQFAAENVYHKTDNQNGKGTFNGIVIIACSILTLIWVGRWGGWGNFTPPPPSVGFSLITQKW